MARSLPPLALAAGLATTFAAPALGATWSTVQVLPRVPSSVAPAVVVAPKGGASAVLVRTGTRPRILEVARRASTRAAWRARASVRGVPRGRLATPRVGVDARGRAVAAWSDARGIWLSERRSPSGPWSTPWLVSGLDRPQRAWGWSMSVAPDGDAIVAWHTRGAVRAATRQETGRFTAPTDVARGSAARATAPSAQLVGGDRALVAWLPASRGAVESALRPSPTEPFERLDGIRGTPARDPELGGGGGAAIVYGSGLADEDGSDVLVRRLDADGRSWGDPITLWSAQDDGGGPQRVSSGGLVVDRTGRAAVLLLTQEGEPGDARNVRLAVLDPGGSAPATPPRRLGVQYEDGARLVASGPRSAVVAWYQQGDPDTTSVPRRRDTFAAVLGAGREVPTRTRRLGGTRTELAGLYGGPSGAAAVLRETRRIRVATYG